MHKYFKEIIIFLFFILSIIFICNYSFFIDKIIFNNFNDYFADFYNHARLSGITDVYTGPAWSLGERGLPPLHYIIFHFLSQTANYNLIPTNFLNGFSLNNEICRGIYFSNYILCVISVLFYIFLYEKLELKNKYLKYIVMFVFLLSYPFMFEFERGNIILLTVFLVSYFMFNYNSESKAEKAGSITAISIASAMKVFPCAFLLLYLHKKKFKEFFITLSIILLIFLFSFLFFDGGLINILYYLRNSMINKHIYHYNTSSVIFFISTLTALFSFKFKDEWKKCLSITLLILIAANFVGYRLLYLFPVIIMVLNKKDFQKTDYIYLLLLFLIICPIHIIKIKILGTILSVLLLINLLTDVLKKTKNILK